MKHMYKYFISICLLFVFVDGFSQEQKTDTLINSKTDSIIYKTNYGLRLGVDISKPILAQFNSTYSGFEVVGDYYFGDFVLLQVCSFFAGLLELPVQLQASTLVVVVVVVVGIPLF